MSEQQGSNQPGQPDGFVRGGQTPPQAQPPQAQPSIPRSFPQWAPPAPGTAPYAASGYQQPTVPPQKPKGSKKGRLLLGLGAAAVAVVLGVATSISSGSLVGVGVPSGTQTAASAPVTQDPSSTQTTDPADPGSSVDPGTSGNSGNAGSGSATQTGTSTQKAATASESRGVVLINTTLTSGSAAGTGMIIDSSGYVLTNYHVVQGSTSIKVTIATTGKTYTATVVGHDATNDVALIKLKGASGLETVTLDRDAVTRGETVTAVGNAQGQGYLTGASGTITKLAATVTVSNDSASGSETLTNVYETNAGAQPGDSGGPLFDSQNEVLAMTTAGEQTYSGPRSRQSSTTTTVASYAIPIARAMAIVKQIEAGNESGTVAIGANPYLGVTIAQTRSGLPVVSGAQAGTPAANAGLVAGDTITSVGGTAVTSQATLAAALLTHQPGDTVKITWTDASGDAHSASVVLADSPVN